MTILTVDVARAPSRPLPSRRPGFRVPRRLALVLLALLALLLPAACRAEPPPPGEEAPAPPPEQAAPATEGGAGAAAQELAAVQDVLPATELSALAWEGVTPLHELDGIYLAGQPGPDDLARAKEAGVTTVVDLRRADEDRGYDEAARAAELGLEYVSIPVGGPEDLTDEAFERLRQLMGPGREGGVLVHCRTSNRCGPFWIAHRVLDEGISFEQAEAEARVAGLKTEAFVDAARAYVERQP